MKFESKEELNASLLGGFSDKDPYIANNWNNLEDPIDKATWEKLIENFWTDTRIPVSLDRNNWKELDEETRTVVNRAFGGLTLLDTLQSREGANALTNHTRTAHEMDVLNNIRFMESMHAKSYSTIFITLESNKNINEIFSWCDELGYLQNKAHIINKIYLDSVNNPSDLILGIKAKIASVFLESFLFYSGFYSALRLSEQLSNVVEIIKLIIRDESVHGTYIGYKAKLSMAELPEDELVELQNWTYDLLDELYENECKYTEYVYDSVGWTEDVKTFVQYNANKALMNLGMEPFFSTTAEDVNPIIMNGIKTSTVNHDFFSKVGNGYKLGEVEATDNTDYDFIKNKNGIKVNKDPRIGDNYVPYSERVNKK